MIMSRVGQNRIYIGCIYGIFGREITKYMVIYDVLIRLWPTLMIHESGGKRVCPCGTSVSPHSIGVCALQFKSTCGSFI